MRPTHTIVLDYFVQVLSPGWTRRRGLGIRSGLWTWNAENLPDMPKNLPDRGLGTHKNSPDIPKHLPDKLVSRPSARTPPSTRAGGQDDGSLTNSLK